MKNLEKETKQAKQNGENRRLLFVRTKKGNIDWVAEKLFRRYCRYETAILDFSQVTKKEINRAEAIFVMKIGQKRAIGRIDSNAKTKTIVLGSFQMLGNLKRAKIKHNKMLKSLKILAVCYSNLHRSRTVEWLLHENYTVESCGISSSAIQPIKSKHVEFADKILVMEQFMADEIVYRYPEAKYKTTVLNITDNDICSELILELNNKLNAEGFRTLEVKDFREAAKECLRWVDNKIRKEKRSNIQEANDDTPLPFF